MAILKRRKGSGVAHIPFYKDEKVIGKKITVSFSVRLFVLAVVLFVLAFGWALFRIMDNNAKLSQFVKNAHLSRIADQNHTQAEIDQLACYIIANLRDREAPIVSKVREQYECPPYGKDPNFKLYKPLHQPPKKASSKHGQASGGGSSSKKATSHPGSGERKVIAGPPAQRPTRRGGHRSPAPKPVPSPSPSPSPSPGPTPVVPLPVSIPPVTTSGPIGVVGSSGCAVRVGNVCVAGS